MTDHDLPVSDPADAGLDASVLEGLEAQFAAWPEANIHCALIARGGRLAFERYFAGTDERWGRPLGRVAFDAATAHDLRSITKSVVSLLAGAVLGEDRAALDTPVFDLFPEHADLATGGKQAMTLRHLLEMSSGLAWDEDRPYSDPLNSERQMGEARDRVRFVLEQPLVRPPGASWLYNGGTTALIGEALARRAGQPLDVLARERLFAPLGIAPAEWVRYDDGTPVAASGLRLRPRDTLKLGELVRLGGAWDGRQVVPAAWIPDSTAPQINGQGLFFYGWQWWLGRSLVKRQELRWIAGVGWGGQRLFVVPERQLVVLVHAGLYDEPMMQPLPGEVVLRRYALAACL